MQLKRVQAERQVEERDHGRMEVCSTAGCFYPVHTARFVSPFVPHPFSSNEKKIKCEWPTDSPSYCRLAAIGVSHLPMSAREGRHWRAAGEGVG